ncbi:hypothetical protein EJB05_46210, partial [Eragrostis curvula]
MTRGPATACVARWERQEEEGRRLKTSRRAFKERDHDHQHIRLRLHLSYCVLLLTNVSEELTKREET